ncbi:MAG: autotransporter-associated beta strand repeat-containing protein [Bacteroidia bacterium]|nr:autotransporter-associated beta strand repeat-containing protein [Bacteroidia bacterium]
MRTFAQFTKNHTNQSVAGDCSSLHPVMDKGIISQSKSEQNIGSNTYPVQKFQLSIRAFVLMIIMFSSIGFYTSLFGQAVGDYGTRYNTGTSTAWATGTNWVICVSAGTWTGATTAAAAPTNTKNVWIRAGANYNVAANSTCLNLDIASTGSLSVGGFTFTVSGTTSISGTFTITSNTAVKTFTGLVTMNSGGSWTSTTSTTATRLIFKNGITNNSSNIFNAGGATFNTNAQVTGGTGSFSFSQVTVTGVTVTNNTVFTVTTALGGTGQLTNAATGTLNLSGTGASCSITTLANAGIINRSNTGTTTTALANFTNTGTINITGSGTITGIINNAAGIVNHSGSSAITSFTNATATSTLNISTTPTVPTITTLTAATAGNTVNYSGAGNQTVKATAYSNLTISGNGTKTLAAATPTVNGVLTVKAGATLDLGGNALGATTAPTSVVLEIGSTGSIISGTTGALNLGGNVTVNATTGSSGATISCPISLDGTRTFTVADDGTAATDLTISGVMSLGTGTGWGITKAGLGTLVLSGTNTYTGTTTVGAGIVDIQNSSALGTTAGVTTVSANASVQVDGTGLSIAEPITLNNSSGISSGGALRNLANSNTWSGAITLTTAGRVNSDAGTLTLTGGVTGAVGTAFTVGGAGNVTMNTTGINTGTSGTLTKDGTGTLTLNASGTYTGGTTVSAGIVDIQNNTALGSTGGITTVSANASVQVDGTGLSIAEPITLNNSDGISLGGALRNLANNNTWTGAITLTTAGRVNSDAGTLTLTGGVTGAVGTAFTVGGAGNVTMNTTGINTGASGTLTKDGTGTLTLNASGTYTGGTTVSAGIVDVQNNTALGSTGGVTTVSANAAVQVDGTGLSIAEPITLNNSSGISSGGALRNLANSNTWSGAITLTTAGRVNSDAGTLTLTGGVTGAAGTAFTVGGAGNVTMNTTGINTGISGTLTKDGTGTLTLNASGTYTGGTTLSVGQLNINHLTAIGSGSLTISSGTTIDNTSGLAIGPLTNNNAQTWNGNFTFNGSNDLDMGTGAITMGADVVITSSTIGKTLTAGGTNNNSTRSLSKAGNGNLTFGSTAITLNNFTVIAGTLTSTSGILSVAGNFSNSSIFAHNIGTVNVNGSTVQTIGGSTSSTFNNLTIANTSGGVSLTKNETVSGVLTLTNGILSTDATNYMAVTNNSGGAVTGSSASSYVNGPLQWTLLSGNSYLFPVGDAANYRPFELNSTVCSSPVIRVTMASTGASTVDGTLSSVAARNWYAQLMSGTFTSATVRLTETGLTTSNSVASATVAQSGPYTNQGGNSIAGGTITSNAAIPYSGSTYFAIGTLPPTVVLSNNGTQVAAANVVGGTNNVVLHQSALAVTVANATLTGMTCTTAGSYVSADITNMKVWYQTTSTFNAGTATLLSTFTNPGIAGAKTFPSFVSQSITSGTSGYIFITADVAPGAVLGHTINLSALTTGDFSFTLATKSGSTTAGGAQTIIAGTATKLVYTVVPSTGTAGTAFSVTVQSQDANGNPSNPTSNTTITLSKATGAGTLSGTLTGIITTAGNSVTIATPVYSKADVMTLTATATVGMTGLTAVTSGNITFSAGTATHLVYTTVPSTGTAGTAFSVTVQSQDANGNPSNPTSNTTITLSKATGAGTLSGTLTGIITTAGNSVTIATPVYSMADVMTLTATATVGMTGLTAVTSGNITFSAGTVDHFVISAISSPQTAGTAITGITLTAQDFNNNTATSFVSTVTYSGTAGITGTSATFTAGVLSGVSATPTVSGTSLTFVVTGSTKTGTATIATINSGALDHFAISTITSPQTAGTAITGITLTAQDIYNNTATSFISTVTYSGTAGITGTSAAFTAGVLSGVSLTPTVAGTGMTLIITGSTKTGTSAFNVNPGAATQIAINAGNGQSATVGTAVAILPSVIVKDANNNVVSGVAVTFAVAFGGGSATGLAATTNASGIATVGSWTLGTTAGANSLTATSAGLTGSPRTFTATGTAGAATQIAINAGDGQTATAGSTVAILPSVIVKDVNNNVVSGVAVTFADTGGGSGTGLNATTNASGIATVGSWTLSATAGANSLTATSAGLTGSPLTFTATGIAGTATQIAINAGDGQTATVATAVAILPSVIVSDANNNPVSGVTVIFSVASGGGFGTGLSKTTDVNGIASISSWTLGNTVGTNTLTATSTGLTGSPSTFTATGTAGVETQIAINAGNGQSATAGTAVAILPSAIVKDVYNNPVSGVAVTFAVASGGGSGTGFNATTDVNGIATVGSWTLGATAGTNTLTATSGTLTGSPVTFTATGTAVPAAISTVTGGPWATAGTWVGNAVPLTTQDAIINGPVSVGATINQTGSVTINNGGTLTATTGGTTVTIGALTINTGGTLTNSRTLTINGATNITGTINLQTSVRTNAFNGDITLNSGAIWNEIVGNTPTITGNFTNNATTFTASTGLYTFSGASNTFSGATTTAIPSVNISGNYTNNGTLTVNTALSGAGTLTNAATLNLAGTCSTATISNTGTINSSGTGTTTTATLTNSGAFNMSGTGAVTAFTNNTTGVLNISSTTVPAFTTLTATAAGNTVNYSGAAQTIKATTYSNLTLSGTGGKTFPTGTTTVNNILSIENAANANTFTGTLSYGANATLQYNTSSARVAGAEWISPFVATGGVVIANTGAITINSPEVFNATAPLTINSGATLNMSTNLLTLNGDLINNGGTTSGSGGVTITGTATQNIGAFTTTGTVLMSKTSGTATFTGNVSGAGLTINGTAGILNLGTGLTHTFSGTWTRTAGTLNGGSSSVSFSNATAFSGTGGTFTANAGTVNYSRAGTQNIAVLTYNNLILSGGGGFAKTFTATTTINGNLSIAASTIANLGAGLTHPANSLTLGGAGQVSGTWGGTGSAATNINTTYFTATTGIVNVSSMGAPTAISATPNSINFGDTGTISLTASGGGGTGATLTWYAGGCGSGASIGTGSPLVINKPAVTTTYYARWESGLQYSSCLSATVTVSNATFYSYQSGDWNTANTWTTDPSGSFWVNGGIPASTDHVIILNGRTITVNENGKTINSLELRLGGTLDLQATNTHNFGTVTGQGVLKLASGIFPGGTYTGFVAVTGGTVEYYNLNNQSISSTQLTYNKLIVSNYTASAYTTYLDNASNNISYTLNGTFDLMNHGAGSLTFYFGNPTPSDNLINMTVAGNFSVASGCTIGVNNFASAHTIAASDVSTSLVNPVHSLTLNGNFTNNGSVRFTGLPSPFNNAYYLLTTTANGGINYGDVQVIFTGAANNTVTCNGTTDFFRFIVEKGSDQTYTLDVNSSNTANFALYGPNNMGNNNFAGFGYYYKALFLHYGTLKLNSNISIPSISEGGQDFLLNPSASLWVNGANVSTTVSGLNGTAYQAATFYGKLRVSSGQFSTGDAAGIVLGNLSTPEINIEGTGTLDVSQVWNATGASNLISYTQTGGTANFRLMGENHAGAVLSLDNPNTVFNMSGGTINFTNNAFIDASTDYRLFNIQVQPGKYTITGGTLNVNVPGSATVYTSNTTVPFYNMNLTNRTGLGTVTLQMEAPGPNLTVLNDFSIGNGAILDMNINTIGLEVDRNFSIASGGTYTPGANTTTFNGSGVQTFTNTGTISTGLYNFTLSNTSNTNITNNLIVTGLLTIGNGCILNDQGFTINANGNIINSGTHSSQANGSILLNGTLAQTIGGSGTGIFGNLGLDKAAGTTSFVANQAINGNLRLVTGILNIANHNLKFSATSAIYDALTGTAAPTTFGDTKMIKTTGSQSDGGVTKTFSATGSFLYPFGAATYHPATIAISQAPTHWGDVTVKPVAVVHPSVDPIKNALTYYWKVTSSSITGIQPGSISHTYHYNPADVTGNDNTYITGVYRPFAWVKGDALQVDIIGKNIYFPAIQYLDGEYTAGETTAFGTVKVYYSRANGNWDTTTTWSLVSNADGTSPGTIPGPSDLVVIGDGGTNNHLVTISANTKIVSGLQINTGSTLDVNTTTGHIFGSVTGIGKLRISSSAATAVFPSGDFGSFLGVAGGTVEYYNETAPGNIGIAFTLPTTYLLGSTPANIATYYNLILSPATGKNITMPDTDLLIYKDMNINVSGSSVTGIALLNIQNTTRNITINGNLNVNNGNLQFTNAGSIAQNVSVVGDVTVASGATFDVAANLAATNTLSVQGNLTNNGIFDMIAGVGQICDVTFTGAANKQINGTTATRTDFNTLTINKGTDRTSILEATVNAMTLNSTLASAMTLTNGTFRLSNAGVNLILSTTNSFTIPSTGCLSANLGTLNVGAANNNASDLLLLGRLEILNAGIVNIGNNGGSNNDIEYAASGSPEINISGGSLNVDGQVRRNLANNLGSLIYNQSGGTVTVKGNSFDATRSMFEVLNTGSQFNVTGGNIVIVKAGSSYADLDLEPGSYIVNGSNGGQQ